MLFGHFHGLSELVLQLYVLGVVGMEARTHEPQVKFVHYVLNSRYHIKIVNGSYWIYVKNKNTDEKKTYDQPSSLTGHTNAATFY